MAGSFASQLGSVVLSSISLSHAKAFKEWYSQTFIAGLSVTKLISARKYGVEFAPSFHDYKTLPMSSENAENLHDISLFLLIELLVA